VTCTVCYHEVGAARELDRQLLPVAKELVEARSVEGLYWLMILREALLEHDWGNATYRGWVLKNYCDEAGVNVVPFLWAVDGFARKHGVDLNEVARRKEEDLK